MTKRRRWSGEKSIATVEPPKYEVAPSLGGVTGVHGTSMARLKVPIVS